MQRWWRSSLSSSWHFPVEKRGSPMARKQTRPSATQQAVLEPLQTTCRACGSHMRMGHHSHRTVTTLQGVTRLTLKVYRCRNTQCPRFHQPTRPEEEGGWALPHGEFGLDVIALVGTLLLSLIKSYLSLLDQVSQSRAGQDASVL